MVVESEAIAADRVAAPVPAVVHQPEVATMDQRVSTFSLNVSDVSFKLAAATLANNALPSAASIRSEEFVNAFDYHDPLPGEGAPVSLAFELARNPFGHNRDWLRLSLRTAARGREAGRPLNIVILLDSSGSMERADRVAIMREAMRVLASQLRASDRVSVVTFARTARLWIDGLPGDQAGELVERVGELAPQGGTDLGAALKLAYATAHRMHQPGAITRVVLMTDGAANLGDVDPESLRQLVEENRRRGIALDCYGVGWDGYNDDLLEVLSRNGDGRYGFLNTVDGAAAGFAAQLAGALQPAASDVKVQVEFNPSRVVRYRQVGYARRARLRSTGGTTYMVDGKQYLLVPSGSALTAFALP